MFGLTALDFAISLSFVYLLLSLICSAVLEWIAGLLGWRGKMLRDGIQTLLTGGTATAAESSAVVERFYRHPLIRCLYRGDRLPSYIGAGTFAKVLLELAPQVRKDDPHLDETLTCLAKTTGPAAAPAAEANLAEATARCFDDTMDRVSGWYRRRSQIAMAIIAALVTITLNADTIRMTRTLWANPALREQLVAEAKGCVERSGQNMADYEYKDKDNPDPEPPLRKIRESCADPARTERLLGQLLGWDADLEALAKASQGSRDVFAAMWAWLGGLLGAHLAGWLITALAISQGAHFWFDRLKEVVNLRAAGVREDDKKPAEAAAK